VDITIAGFDAAARRHAAAVTIGSVYELKYVAALASDVTRAKYSLLIHLKTFPRS